jgi:RNA polymerase sigma-70 factor (ECF subfamily)
VEDDEERFSGLFKAHYPDVVRFAARRRLAQVPPDGDEAVAWLYGVARNVLTNEQRGHRRRLRLGARLWSAAPVVVGHDHAAGVAQALDVRAAMSRLSPRDQEALQLVGWDGLDAATAARVVGCSPRAFAVRLHRARRRLDQALEAVESKEIGTSARRRDVAVEARRS